MGNLLCCCSSVTAGTSQNGIKSKCPKTNLKTGNMKEPPGVDKLTGLSVIWSKERDRGGTVSPGVSGGPRREENQCLQLSPSTHLDLDQKIEHSQNSNAAPALPGSGFLTASVRMMPR